MERNKQVLTLLLEMTVALGIEPLSVKRQALYLRHLANWSVEDLRWACDRAVQECRFPIMPLPGVLIDYARAAPRRQIQGDLTRTALDHTTSYNDKLAEEAINAVMALFPDDFDRKGMPPVIKTPSAAEQRTALMVAL